MCVNMHIEPLKKESISPNVKLLMLKIEKAEKKLNKIGKKKKYN